MTSAKYALGAAAVAMVLAPVSPAVAGGDTEKVALAAALGLTAADGKTTLSNDAGKIEAALLISEAIEKAGDRIAIQSATAITGNETGKTVLVLGRDQQSPLFIRNMIDSQIKRMRDTLSKYNCPKSGADQSGGMNMLGTTDFKDIKLAPSDFVAALATSTNYAGIAISLDERMLLNAVAARWTQYRLPGEVVSVDETSHIITSFKLLVAKTNELRECVGSEPYKSLVAGADGLVAGLTASTDKSASPLIIAAQYETLTRDSKGPPLILRVALEQQGGTAITRSNIWYTLGFPGAARISAGLIASYRLVRTDTGAVLASGFVRCAVAPVEFAMVAKRIGNSENAICPPRDVIQPKATLPTISAVQTE